jgi:hypothetical protein
VAKTRVSAGGWGLLSRLYRKAEALDGACLRAWGHPDDYAVRQELLEALEWDSSVHPEHARPLVRELFAQVHTGSVELAIRIRSSAGSPAVVEVILHHVQPLRQRLTSLMQVLEARRTDARTE